MKEITLKVLKAQVLLTNGQDDICLTIDAPTTHPDMGYDPCIDIKTQANYGKEWCKEVLGIEPEVTNVRNHY